MLQGSNDPETSGDLSSTQSGKVGPTKKKKKDRHWDKKLIDVALNFPVFPNVSTPPSEE